MSDPFAPEPAKPRHITRALSTASGAIFAALALGAGMIKASVYVVAFLALIAFAYALDVRNLAKRPPRD